MAPKFEPCSEMKDLIKELKSKRSDLFDFVDPEMIGCGLRIDKAPPENQKWVLKMEGIKGSKTLINPVIKYIVWGYESVWTNLSSVEKLAYVANMILRIRTPTDEEILKLAEKGDEWEWGKMKAPDIVDMKSWLKAFGVDWNDVGDEVIDILDKEKIPTLE